MLGIRKDRVIVYIDGFNLYFGLREKGWRKYYWLNLRLLARNLLKPNQYLARVKYFTARISGGGKDAPLWLRERMEAKRKRQAVFLEALATLDDFHIFEGHYLPKIITCKKCGNSWSKPEEKMTDVHIATELMMDALNDAFDTALIISGDSDLVPAVVAVSERFKQKRIIVAFPPKRSSDQLRMVARSFSIGEAKLRKSIFPDHVRKADGHILRRPQEWR